MASDITQSWTYPLFDPAQEVVGIGGLMKAMPLIWGPNWDSTVYSSLFNIRTGALMSKPHHCTYNDTKGHATTRRCFTDGHQGYCNEWIDEAGFRVRCGMRYKIESGGCSKHRPNTMKHSINLQIKNLIAGKRKSISWGELNDPERTLVSANPPSQTINETTKAILEQSNEQLEAMDAVGALPVENHTAYDIHKTFNENKRARERVEAERRKTQAAQRRSNMTGKNKSAATDEDEEILPVLQHQRIAESEKKRMFGRSLFKSGAKGVRADAAKWANKRGGKNVPDSSSKK